LTALCLPVEGQDCQKQERNAESNRLDHFQAFRESLPHNILTLLPHSEDKNSLTGTLNKRHEADLQTIFT
jgi:hypothetical protein